MNDLRNPKWMDVIQPYVKNDHIFDCPSDGATKKIVTLASSPNRGTGTNPPGGSYLINTAYNGGGSLAGPAGQSLAVIGSPVDTIFIAEGPSVVNNQFYWSSGAANPTFPLTPYASYSSVSSGENNSFHVDTKTSPAYFGYQDSSGRRYLFLGRHNGQGSLVFCDGNAKCETVEKPSATHSVSGKNLLSLVQPGRLRVTCPGPREPGQPHPRCPVSTQCQSVSLVPHGPNSGGPPPKLPPSGRLCRLQRGAKLDETVFRP